MGPNKIKEKKMHPVLDSNPGPSEKDKKSENRAGDDNDKKREKEDETASVVDDDEDEEEGIMTTATFESLGVVEPLCLAAQKMGWKVASRIQAQVLPHALEGKDIVGLAETGSGKTGAFCIPILQELLANPVRGAVYAVILAPTRELAFQIHEVVEGLGIAMGVNSVCIVGGVDIATQSIALARNPHVVVATPGRLVDHLTHTKGFHLRKVRYLIMDEADRMLSLDFEQELNQILDVMPDSTAGRRTMLFSATMTSKVEKLQRASLHNPVRVEVSTKFQTPKKLLQSYLFIPAKYKDCYLTYLVNEHAGQSMLVFGATCNNVQRLALMLRNLGFPAVCLHGQMSQPKRLGALNKFKSGDREILICTDVAARGLDIPSVDVVINFDLPGHGKDYIHRVGRTARAGRSGKAIAMVTQYDVEVYQRLEGLLGKKLPELKLDEETVLVLLERVSEAQRLATRELKEQLAAMGNKGGGRRKRGTEDDGGEGDEMEKLVQRELKKGYAGGSGGRGGALPNQRGFAGKQKPNHKKQKRK
ncbi:DEAD box helicase-like protein [Fragilaria crotonensis]|nr:DEAD box helicase-like protein [Fragilaria crotonensis]